VSITIGIEDLIMRKNQYLTSDMDGERVMMSIESGKYYNLGGIGGRVWDMMETPIVIRQIIEHLLQEYEVDREICEQQVIRFLQQMKAEGMVQIVSSDSSTENTVEEKVGER